MDKLDILKLLLTNRLGPDRWTFSENGSEGEAIQEIDCGIQGLNFWIKFEYNEGDKIKAIMPLNEFGKRGGKDTIWLNDEAVENDDFVMGAPRVRLDSRGITITAVLEFKYAKDGQNHRIRFDGRIV